MAIWGGVRDYLCSTYEAQGDDESLTLVFNVSEGRTQLVIVHPAAEEYDHAHVRFFSPFATVDQVTPQQITALTYNTSLGVASFGEWFGFLHIAFLADLDPGEVELALQMVTMYADRAEQQLGLGDEL